MQVDLVLSQAAFLVGDRPAKQGFHVVGRKRLELEYPAAADQGAVNREEGILGGGPDQDCHALFDVGQQDVLLGLVEAVDLIDEQQRPLSRRREPVAGFAEDFPQFFHAAGHGAQLAEVAAGGPGQQAGERGLAGAGRAVEDHRTEAVGRQQPAEQFAFAQEVLLSDELVQRPRPHPRC